ncbi:Protein of unknown function, partial [Gryllus bimaculatus]
MHSRLSVMRCKMTLLLALIANFLPVAKPCMPLSLTKSDYNNDNNDYPDQIATLIMLPKGKCRVTSHNSEDGEQLHINQSSNVNIHPLYASTTFSNHLTNVDDKGFFPRQDPYVMCLVFCQYEKNQTISTTENTEIRQILCFPQFQNKCCVIKEMMKYPSDLPE